jgi:hypothetical protein
MIEASTTFVEVEGIRTAQAVVGDGMPVSRLGAHLDLMWHWRRPFSPCYRLYLPDLPGLVERAATC